MERIKVLVVSSVVPNERGSGGELVLHRHLQSNQCIESEVVSFQQFPFRLKVIGKLRQLGFQSLSRYMECLFPVLPSKRMVDDAVRFFRPDVILTVAHGSWHIHARQVAGRLGLPLISFFQDWWPDFPDVPLPLRSRVEREFRKTCGKSHVAICVSNGMRRELGQPENALVLHDAPSLTSDGNARPESQLPLRVAYFGNLSEYGPLIESALRVLKASEHVQLEVFGAAPLWTNGAEDEFRSWGVYRGFVAPSELAKSLYDFHAALVVMSFAPSHQRRMTTSFPSKLIDATQLGLPLVIWGPDYCSAVKWASNGNKALYVTDPNPLTLRQRLEELAVSPSERRRLAKSASDAAATDFSRNAIQLQFVEALRNAKDHVEKKP